MKVLIVVTLALTLATASNFNLSESERVPRGRVLNGQDADPTKIPFIVGINKKVNNPYGTWCSGALIKKNWILTAAHCLIDVNHVDILLGAALVRQPDKKITVMAKDTIVHEDYNVVNYLHDIALIKIPSVDFTDRIRPINLPQKGNSNYAGKKVLVSGWGATTTNMKTPVDKLQWGRMEVVSNDECSKVYKNMASCYRINTKAVDGVRPHSGDSGGPLVLTSNRNVIIGVHSMSVNPKVDRGINAVFTNVQAHLDWINKNIN